MFHKQLEPVDLSCDEHRNRHILFRKKFTLSKETKDAKIYISADDYYKLYINGKFVGQGPINRVWQSSDNRHGLILDLIVDGEVIVATEETFKTKLHYQFN